MKIQRLHSEYYYTIRYLQKYGDHVRPGWAKLTPQSPDNQTQVVQLFEEVIQDTLREALSGVRTRYPDKSVPLNEVLNILDSKIRLHEHHPLYRYLTFDWNSLFSPIPLVRRYQQYIGQIECGRLQDHPLDKGIMKRWIGQPGPAKPNGSLNGIMKHKPLPIS